MKKKKSDNDYEIKVYTDEELKLVEEHIEKYYGHYDKVFKGDNENDLCADVCIIEPSIERNYYTLVTVGMGAYRMNVPKDLESFRLDRAELIIFMPPDWNIDSDDDDNFWTVKLLRVLAALPVRKNSWLGWGHTVDYTETFTKNSQLSAVILLNPVSDNKGTLCHLPDNTTVNFYQVLPLCRNELDFRSKFGTEELIHLFGRNIPLIVETDREPFDTKNYVRVIDTIEKHSRKIEKKELDIPEINAANHIAAYLLWCIEHDMIDEEFTDYFSEEIEDIRNGRLDIRKFVINSLDGELTEDILTEEGRQFAYIYYHFRTKSEKMNYPADVDRSAIEYFGEEKYNCAEFKDEAYLFMPFDDDYIKRMNKYIDKGYTMYEMLKKFRLPKTPSPD